VQLKPVTAVVQDIIAHTFFKMQHLATIHYENGKYHVHTELEKIATDEGELTKNKTQESKKSEKQTQQISDFLRAEITSECETILFATSNSKNSSGFQTLESPPPEFKLSHRFLFNC
jgi:hypothetical protein